MCDYYATQPWKPGSQWVDIDTFVVTVRTQITPEERAKRISEGLKRRKHSRETRRKISQSLKGKKKSKEHKEKIRQSKRGKKMDSFARVNMSHAARTRNFIIIKNGG